jgi:hypothetical protein
MDWRLVLEFLVVAGALAMVGADLLDLHSVHPDRGVHRIAGTTPALAKTIPSIRSG